MSFFSWLCVFGNDDERAVAARIGDQREADAGVAGGRLDHEPAGLELAALLGLQDHLAAGAVLHRLPGIHELGLAEDGAAGRLRGPLELDQRRVADGLDDAVADLHARFPVGDVTTLVDAPGATRPWTRVLAQRGIRRAPGGANFRGVQLPGLLERFSKPYRRIGRR